MFTILLFSLIGLSVQLCPTQNRCCKESLRGYDCRENLRGDQCFCVSFCEVTRFNIFVEIGRTTHTVVVPKGQIHFRTSGKRVRYCQKTNTTTVQNFEGTSLTSTGATTKREEEETAAPTTSEGGGGTTGSGYSSSRESSGATTTQTTTTEDPSGPLTTPSTTELINLAAPESPNTALLVIGTVSCVICIVLTFTFIHLCKRRQRTMIQRIPSPLPVPHHSSPIFFPLTPPSSIDTSTPLYTPSLFSTSETSSLSDVSLFDVSTIPAAAPLSKPSYEQIDLTTFNPLKRVTRSMTKCQTKKNM
ncbi:mucin-2-like [Saccostrea cucullata]|uniref:mucin-2-like n=1 Tax=Saccostrea cuccullata TaxID=36930 RepID=UPI002ED4B322